VKIWFKLSDTHHACKLQTLAHCRQNKFSLTVVTEIHIARISIATA